MYLFIRSLFNDALTTGTICVEWQDQWLMNCLGCERKRS